MQTNFPFKKFESASPETSNKSGLAPPSPSSVDSLLYPGREKSPKELRNVGGESIFKLESEDISKSCAGPAFRSLSGECPSLPKSSSS